MRMPESCTTRRLAVLGSQICTDSLRFLPPHAVRTAAVENQPPHPRYTEVPRLLLGSDAAVDHLEAHGFVVCAGALTETECDDVLDGMWSWLESLGTGIDRAEPASWGGQAWPPDAGVGILTNAGVTHTDWAWRVRAHPSVVAAWQSVLKLPSHDNALIASLDGLTMFRPWGLPEAEESWVTRGGWWHMDQAAETSINSGGQPVGGTHREYVQGFVTMVDTSEHSGGFAVVADSHKQFAHLKGNPSAADYSRAFIPALKKGDLLMWDSRALHCNCPGEGAGRLSGPAAGQASQPQLLRATVHMCLSPKSLATDEVLQQRRWAYRCVARRPASQLLLRADTEGYLWKLESTVFIWHHPCSLLPNGVIVHVGRENLTLNHQAHHLSGGSPSRLVRAKGYIHPAPAPLSCTQLELLG